VLKEDLRVGWQRETGRINRDELAGAHPKIAPDLVLLSGACQARLSKNEDRSYQIETGRRSFCYLSLVFIRTNVRPHFAVMPFVTLQSLWIAHLPDLAVPIPRY
jgi:hypothetical protein